MSSVPMMRKYLHNRQKDRFELSLNHCMETKPYKTQEPQYLESAWSCLCLYLSNQLSRFVLCSASFCVRKMSELSADAARIFCFGCLISSFFFCWWRLMKVVYIGSCVEVFTLVSCRCLFKQRLSDYWLFTKNAVLRTKHWAKWLQVALLWVVVLSEQLGVPHVWQRRFGLDILKRRQCHLW